MPIEQMNEYFKTKELICRKNDNIPSVLYEDYGVKKGLRDKGGNGVLAGLTNISKIVSFDINKDRKIPCQGKL